MLISARSQGAAHTDVIDHLLGRADVTVHNCVPSIFYLYTLTDENLYPSPKHTGIFIISLLSTDYEVLFY